MKKRDILLLISVLAILVFLINFYSNISEVSEQTYMRNGSRSKSIPLPIQYRMWLTPLTLIIAIVPLSYYFISKKLENNMKVMLKLVNKNNNIKNNSVEINKDAILKLLNFNEKKVLEKLIYKRGEALQSEISRMKEMNKLKTHRAIKNLEMKGVIKIEDYGKTKRIILAKDVKNIMLK